MSTYGRIEPFSGSGEEFEVYIERLSQYLEANDLHEIALRDDNSNSDAVTARKNKRRAILLSVMGNTTYGLVRNLLSPAKPAEKSYDDIVKVLRDHYRPATSVTVNRYRFHTRLRKSGESVADYVSDLRKLADDCDFGANLEVQLCDRLVCGINDSVIQKRLLIEKELTFTKAYGIAVAQELAVKNASVLQGNSVSGASAPAAAGVNAVLRRPSPSARGRSLGRGGNRGGPSRPAASSLPTPAPADSAGRYCYRCGETSHLADRCRQIRTKCNYCHQTGHLAKVCLRRQRRSNSNRGNQSQTRGIHMVTPSTTTDGSNEFDETLYAINEGPHAPICANVSINGKDVQFQVDTGASVSCMNQRDFDANVGITLRPYNYTLGSYSGHAIEVKGCCDVTVKVGNVEEVVTLVVVGGTGPPLLGRSWLRKIKLPWKEMFTQWKTTDEMNHLSDLPNEFFAEFKELFSDGLGLLQGFKAKFEVPTGSTPVFCKARPLPYGMKAKVEAELQKLEKSGVIKKVVYSDWAAPIVPVVKPSGKLRLCGDYKLTINKVIQLDRYPLPQIDEIFTSLNGGKYFTKLDLSQAYHQLKLDEASQPLTTVNTHCGLYQYLRLPYGASPCVGLFQRAMENLLKGLPGVSVFLDDILVTGKTSDEHLQNLRNVLTVLQSNGLKLQKEKCQFMLDSVEYLGFRISTDGIHPTQSKVDAIKKAPSPSNVSEIRSIVGLVNYYGRFLPNLADRLSPLYALMRKDSIWQWTAKHQKAFEDIKDLISQSTGLAHYDPQAELVLTTDASAVGVGAVLEIRVTDGTTRPIAFASRSLTAPERHYAQIEREALGIIFGVQKFRQYLLGRRFTLRTDHRPLVTLFAENHGIPQLASSRIKRWALILSAYSYDVEYISTKNNGCADFLSRAPRQDVVDKESVTSQLVLHVDNEVLRDVPLSAKVVSSETVRDPLLSRVLHFTQNGWPQNCDSTEIKPYLLRKNELSVDQNCLLWGNRVVIPTKLRPNMLLDLHESHIGIVRMKSLARLHFWWPGLSDDIERLVKDCTACQEHASLPNASPPAAWSWPTGPWKRLHIDYAGPFMGYMLLVIVDSYSKWLEVFPLKTATSQATITKLRCLFATHGLPEHLVSDNGSNFTSDEFKTFLTQNGIKHTTTAPGHPATNGLAERYVGFIKKQLRKMSGSSLEDNLYRILLSYRTTPHPATEEQPCALLMKRSLRTRFSLLRPSLDQKQSAKVFEKNLCSPPKFAKGDPVFALNLRAGPRWLPGVIIDVQNRNYFVQVKESVWKRHENQLRPRSSTYAAATAEPTGSVFVPPVSEGDDPVPSIPPAPVVQSSPGLVSSPVRSGNEPASSTTGTSDSVLPTQSPAAKRCPPRERAMPVRFKDYILQK